MLYYSTTPRLAVWAAVQHHLYKNNNQNNLFFLINVVVRFLNEYKNLVREMKCPKRQTQGSRDALSNPEPVARRRRGVWTRKSFGYVSRSLAKPGCCRN